MMKIKLYFFAISFLLIPTCYAGKYWVQFGKNKYQIKLIKPGFVNENCQDCEALKNIEKTYLLSPQELTDVNPGSVVCQKTKGKIAIGKLYNGHSQAFCFYKDKSFVSANLFNVN